MPLPSIPCRGTTPTPIDRRSARFRLLRSTDDFLDLLFARQLTQTASQRRKGFHVAKAPAHDVAEQFRITSVVRDDVVSSGTVVMLKVSDSFFRASAFGVIRRCTADFYRPDHRRNGVGWPASRILENSRNTQQCDVPRAISKTAIISVGRIPRCRKDLEASAWTRSIFPEGNHAVASKRCCNMSLDTSRLGR